MNFIKIPPGTRAVFHPLVALLPFILTLGIASPLEADDRRGEIPVHQFHLQADLSGHVDFGGGLIFLSAGSQAPLLRTELVSPTDPRRRRNTKTFHAIVADGAKGGRRGFSTRADDDQDGRTDEDPLDGIDNDQDGNIDEDFAAISDAMVAIHLNGSGTEHHGVHLEYYHWANPRLSSAVFLNAGGKGESANRGIYRIHASGSTWREARITSLRHTVTGRPEQEDGAAFVCRAVMPWLRS